ncbi:MAG: hypothetical protein IT258_24035 [Saprospiraceae bacterium]|nr:hypothetical protein [Saprospiraceae bacterium]
MLKPINSSFRLSSSITCRLFALLFTAFLWSCQVETTTKQPDLVFDFDQDGVQDQIDLDDDNDGIPDEIETTADIDGDKVPNFQDRDSDGDGINDLIEATGVDKDGDGMLDPWDEWTDENQNGFHDEYEQEPLVSYSIESGTKVWQSEHEESEISIDVDKDGLPNFWDADSDNDGITDLEEWNQQKPVFSKLVDNNADGFDDRLVGHIYTQGDKENKSGHPEKGNEALELYQSIYADGSKGAVKGKPAIDSNNNGIPNFFDSVTN